MCHSVDGKEWKELDEKHPDFACEPQNVRLWLVTNGFTPFRNMSLSCSMWSVVMTAYNLPLWLCTKDLYKMLTFLIPSPNASGKNIYVFLRPLVDELKELWDEGVVVGDAASKTSFQMRVVLLITVNDFPAHNSLSGWSGQGYLSCPSCNDASPSKRILGKICYVGYQQWLPISHGMRNNKKVDGKVDRRPPLPQKSVQQILA